MDRSNKFPEAVLSECVWLVFGLHELHVQHLGMLLMKRWMGSRWISSQTWIKASVSSLTVCTATWWQWTQRWCPHGARLDFDVGKGQQSTALMPSSMQYNQTTEEAHAHWSQIWMEAAGEVPLGHGQSPSQDYYWLSTNPMVLWDVAGSNWCCQK